MARLHVGPAGQGTGFRRVRVRECPAFATMITLRFRDRPPGVIARRIPGLATAAMWMVHIVHLADGRGWTDRSGRVVLLVDPPGMLAKARLTVIMLVFLLPLLAPLWFPFEFVSSAVIDAALRPVDTLAELRLFVVALVILLGLLALVSIGAFRRGHQHRLDRHRPRGAHFVASLAGTGDVVGLLTLVRGLTDLADDGVGRSAWSARWSRKPSSSSATSASASWRWHGSRARGGCLRSW